MNELLPIRSCFRAVLVVVHETLLDTRTRVERHVRLCECHVQSVVENISGVATKVRITACS